MFRKDYARLKLIVCKDYDEMSECAAKHIAQAIKADNGATLGLATGSTPIGTYKQLIAMHKSGELSFADIRTFNLDEYYPIDPTDKQSYRYFMDDQLFNYVDINRANINFPDSTAESGEKAAADYEALLDKSPQIALQLLGIGENGHLAFNEPDTVFSNATHCVELTESTRKANSRFFNSMDEVPTHAVTMGIKSLMLARQLVVLASGANKAGILERALNGAINPQVPASVLQLHGDVYVFADEAAASELMRG